jgi:hypothetical protein
VDVASAITSGVLIAGARNAQGVPGGYMGLVIRCASVELVLLYYSKADVVEKHEY